MKRAEPDYFTSTRSPARLRELLLNGFDQALAHFFKGDALKHRIEEAMHDQLDRFGPRNAARFEIKHLGLIDLTDCCGMGAADIIRLNLKSGDAIGTGFLLQQQVPISLKAIGFLRARINHDHALPDGATVASQRTFEQK